MSANILDLRAVTKCYGLGDGGDQPPVLRDVTLTVAEGASVAVVGPSGSGKSTLLNLIGGLDKPSSGQVLFDGRDLTELGADELAAFRNRQVGFVFQLHHLLPQCTVLENVLVPALPGRRARDVAVQSRARHLLERVGLTAKLASRPGQLSGGERQRVAVVRALINGPRLLLADEPTGSLDAHAAASLVDLLAELNREERVTLIMVTHAAPLAQRMGRVMELMDGILRERPDSR
jgi:lipoprotein-releasing system ATP-binding protein